MVISVEKVYRPDLVQIGTKLFEAAQDRERMDVAITIVAVCLGALIIVPLFVCGVKTYLRRAANKAKAVKDVEMNVRQGGHCDQTGTRQDPTQYSVRHTFDRPSLTNENENDTR